jgi:hypothetical protein
MVCRDDVLNCAVGPLLDNGLLGQAHDLTGSKAIALPKTGVLMSRIPLQCSNPWLTWAKRCPASWPTT